MENYSPKTFVLCFDGTGNKFSGTDSDSNILKIYRMLDRSQGNQFHYYQPGIGTYVTTNSLDHTSVISRFKSWYDKAKDSAVGSSFANHVMAGYRFLMRYYTPGDNIYFFGFSRGAYTARFLAEMLDHVGLLSAGNEELTRFAWKTFSKWQARRGGGGDQDKAKEEEMYTFMRNFRETFSRPVRRIRFLGLFDTVNSVPRFESAWMQRSKFPYTARSSAKVIRHAVSINERRAKFRQDLITSSALRKEERTLAETHRYNAEFQAKLPAQKNQEEQEKQRTLNGSNIKQPVSPAIPTINLPDIDDNDASEDFTGPQTTRSTENLQQKFMDALEHPSQNPSTRTEHKLHLPLRPAQMRRSSMAGPMETQSTENLHRAAEGKLFTEGQRRYSDHTKQQDIDELWFPGGHADIGGGWPKEVAHGEQWPLSHAPLVWMVHEAERAGLVFDARKMAYLNCSPDKIDEYGNPDLAHRKTFRDALHQSGVGGFLHDCLEIGGGLPFGSTLSWKMMEYLPFRRMDLKPDGSWAAIRWPLPGGETRDIPVYAKIHVSAIKRMQEDKKYRPGNLIVGGGGRGVKTAPAKYGIGEWKIIQDEGDPVREAYVRCEVKGKPISLTTDDVEQKDAEE